VRSLIPILLLRAIFVAILIIAFDGLFDFGTSQLLLFSSAACGVLLGTFVAKCGLRARGAALLLISTTLIYWLVGSWIGSFAGSGSLNTFLPYFTIRHLDLAISALLICALSTWAFWRYRHALTFEVLVLSGTMIALLAGHRNYHLDTPQIINSLSWRLGLAPQITLLLVGGIAELFLLIYLYTSPSALFRGKSPVQVHRTKGDLVRNGLAIGALLVLLLFVGKGILNTYTIEKGLTSNGVGEASGADDSPLGFHSALGTNSQPTAVVRLDNDYARNPYLPSLFFREDALSELNGSEMVRAARSFDTDVGRIQPGTPFVGETDDTLSERVQLHQSVYLLSDPRLAFAVDYPIEIKQLKNPDPSRFRGAYRALSLVPTYKLQDLRDAQVGDARWSDEVWHHYTREHVDHRYRDLALQLTEQAVTPTMKAATLAQYLIKHSIYTLSPHHDVKPSADQVAPYLFGDMRGYCVHFSHAMVFMLRGLGIPSRIATGYMTDLSQSRDGHILLRMNDRHAWAEVYLRGYGWVVFDVQPEQVESAADAQVDMQLLEDLMGKLGPDEEILPDDIARDEPNFEEPMAWELPSSRNVFWTLLATLALFISLKCYVRYSWILPARKARKLTRSYRAFLSTLYDLGVTRTAGETRQEYHARIARTGFTGHRLLHLIQKMKYSRSSLPSVDEIHATYRSDVGTVRHLPWWKRALAFCNPTTLFTNFFGRSW
jgi:hypothetical protein